ncbi:MAG TPA: DUF4190 domain-containing protein [Polyangiaceae bacterium]|jgi:hypothetical protein
MQSPAPFERAPWVPSEPIKTNGTAIFALLASIFGFVCFAGMGGLLGIVLGLIARSEITRSEGRENGRGLAMTAIVLGGANLALTVLGVAAAVAYLASHPTTSTSPSPTLPVPTAWAAPTSAPHPTKAPSTAKRPELRASRTLSTEVTSLGTITLADLGGDFASELGKQRHAADAAGEILVLWIVARDCKPCDGVAASLTNAQMQKALGKARFVRVDRDQFEIELERLGIPIEKIPGFALLDGIDHVRDFIHGGEWDADIAANIAPVLGKFVHGSYRPRRHPWHGDVRSDETPI